MFNSKAIKIYCMIRCSSVIIIQMHGIQLDPTDLYLSGFITAPSFIFGKFFLE